VAAYVGLWGRPMEERGRRQYLLKAPWFEVRGEKRGKRGGGSSLARHGGEGPGREGGRQCTWPAGGGGRR
jgi:hypothetical protein